MNNTLQSDISFYRKVQIVQAKMKFLSYLTCLQPYFYVKNIKN